MATAAEAWVEECAKLTKPARIYWCDGSAAENERLNTEMLKTGTLEKLNEQRYPNSYLHRSDPTDVARTEHLTYVCTPKQEDAGPNNNWMSPTEAKHKVGALFAGAMQGRTMYVAPYIMGPATSPYSKVGIELTDGPYVVTNMRIMTRMGKAALERLGNSDDFGKGLHSTGDLSPDRRFIMHFPDEQLVWSIGSGYGGNALLSKKCFALRIASVMGRREGWLAEHMLIMGIQEPGGRTSYVAAAFPSACGKTNLAMLVPPASQKGYKVWTVGDDIAWMHVGKDGRLRAINPEAGFFGVAPGTSAKTNPNMMSAVQQNTIFTNVAVTPERNPWWEGIGETPPEGTLDWLGKPWHPNGSTGAHPNARFTTPASQCPSISPEWENPAGVPISAIIFGGRRAELVPLVSQALDWQNGVYLGATVASETTAAASGKVGVVRRDPMAMLPFCGYNMGDYLEHWLAMQSQIKDPPKIFRVNWFRQNADGKFIWPGFGENLRVLRWIVARSNNEVGAHETPIGFVPQPKDIDLSGTNVSDSTLKDLFAVDRSGWAKDIEGQQEFFSKFGKHLPSTIQKETDKLAREVKA